MVSFGVELGGFGDRRRPVPRSRAPGTLGGSAYTCENRVHSGGLLVASTACSNSAPPDPCDPIDPVLADSSFVVVVKPTAGLRASSPFRVRGCSRSFESNVVWELRSRDGRILASGHTSGGGLLRLGTSMAALGVARLSIHRHTSCPEAMANPEPATNLRPTGHCPSKPGPGGSGIAGELDPISSGPLRWLLFATGLAFVGLAALGAVLPVLPTVPFLLVAAACFARSSTRFYRWLLSNRLFGPLIRDWRETRTIPLRAKVSAITLVALVGGSSVLFYLANPWVKLGVGAILIGLIGFLLSLPTVRRQSDSDHSDPGLNASTRHSRSVLLRDDESPTPGRDAGSIE